MNFRSATSSITLTLSSFGTSFGGYPSFLKGFSLSIVPNSDIRFKYINQLYNLYSLDTKILKSHIKFLRRREYKYFIIENRFFLVVRLCFLRDQKPKKGNQCSLFCRRKIHSSIAMRPKFQPLFSFFGFEKVFNNGGVIK